MMLLAALSVLLPSQAPASPPTAMQPFVLPDGTVPSHVTVLPAAAMPQPMTLSPAISAPPSPRSPVAAADEGGVRTAAAANEGGSLIQTASETVAATPASGRSPYFEGTQPVVQPVSQPTQLVQYPQYQNPYAAPVPQVYPQPAFVQPRGQFNPFEPYSIFRPDQPRILPRPDVIGDGKVAVELGYQGNFFGSGNLGGMMPDGLGGMVPVPDVDDVTEHIGRGLVRVGLAELLELRIGGELSAIDVNFDGLGANELDGGAADVGLKWKLTEQVGVLPEFSVLGEVGWFEVDNDGAARGRILGLAEWELGWDVALGLSGGLVFTGETDVSERDTNGAISVSLAKRIGRAELFAELAGVTDARAYAQLGLLVPIGETIFVHVNGGYSAFTDDIRNAGGDFEELDIDGGFIGAGLTFYTP